MHRDVIGAIALDLVLRIFFARMHDVTFEADRRCNYLDNRAANTTSLRIPANSIADPKTPHLFEPPTRSNMPGWKFSMSGRI